VLEVGSLLRRDVLGTNDGDVLARERWLELFDEVVIPEVTAFEPDLVVVSAGFDAHRDDPLAELRLEDETYRAIAERVRTLTETRCEGRSVWLLEGGYDLRAIAASVAGCLHVLAA